MCGTGNGCSCGYGCGCDCGLWLWLWVWVWMWMWVWVWFVVRLVASVVGYLLESNVRTLLSAPISTRTATPTHTLTLVPTCIQSYDHTLVCVFFFLSFLCEQAADPKSSIMRDVQASRKHIAFLHDIFFMQEFLAAAYPEGRLVIITSQAPIDPCQTIYFSSFDF